MKKILLQTLILLLASISVANAQNTWSFVPGPFGGTIVDLERTSTGKLFATASSSSPFYPEGYPYVSTNNGTTWTPVLLSSAKEVVLDIEYDFLSGNIYILTYNDTYRSIDNGVTFTKQNTDENSHQSRRIKRHPSGRLIGMGHSNLHYSDDEGATWNLGFDTGQPFAGVLRDIEISEFGDIIIAASSSAGGLLRSIDGGESAIEVTTDLVGNFVVLDLEYNYQESQMYCFTRDFGFIYSNDVDGAGTDFRVGDEWLVDNTGLEDLNFEDNYGTEVILSLGDKLILVDNYNRKIYLKDFNGSFLWERVGGLLTADVRCLAGGSVSSFILGTETRGVIRTTNGGTSFVVANNGIDRLEPTDMEHLSDGTVLVTSQFNVHALEGVNNTWSDILHTRERFRHILPLELSETALIIGSEKSYLYNSSNNSITERGIMPPTDVGLVAMGSNTQKLYGLDYGNGQLYYSSDQALTWSAATTVTNLPLLDGFPRKLMVRNDVTNELYLLWYDYDSGNDQVYKIDLTTLPFAASATLVTEHAIDNIKSLQVKEGLTFVYGDVGSSIHKLAFQFQNNNDWIIKDAPPGGQMFVSDQGHIFITRNDGSDRKEVLVSRDLGETYTTITSFGNVGDFYEIINLVVEGNIQSGRAFALLPFSGLYYTNETVIPPSPVLSFDVAGAGTEEVTLSWTDDSFNENAFVVQYFNGTSFVSLDTLSSPAPNGQGRRIYFVDRNRTPGSATTYRVAAINASGNSPFEQVVANTLSVCETTIPDNRSWSLFIVGTEETALNVVVRKQSDGYYSISDVTAGLVSVDEPAVIEESCGTVYIRDQFLAEGSPDIYPTQNGSWNDVTSVLTLHWISNPSVAPSVSRTVELTLNATDPIPAAPQLPRVFAFSSTEVEISWTPTAFETSFVVERSTVSGSGFTQIAEVNYPTSSHIDNTVTPGTTYFYRIIARNSTGDSSPSSEVSIPFTVPRFLQQESVTTTPLTNTIGTLWGDFDNDGDEDLIITNFGIFSLELQEVLVYRNDNGTFTPLNDVFESNRYITASIADYNKDGNLDIFFASSGEPHALYRGNGNFTFTKVNSIVNQNTSSDDDGTFYTSWIDVNSDGLLDLHITFSQYDPGTVKDALYLQTNSGEFIAATNSGDLTIEGRAVNDVVWLDKDNDGDMDAIFVIDAQSVTSALVFENDGTGSFTELPNPGFTLLAETLAGAAGDYNNDGFIDVYVTEQEASSPNKLFRNNAGTTFSQQEASVLMEAQPASTISAVWGDIDNNGFLDLVTSRFGSNTIYLNQNGTTFTKLTTEKFCDNAAINGGLALADYDNDGYLDIAITSLNAFFSQNAQAPPNRHLFKNSGGLNNWLKLKLNGTVSNRSGIGARVKARIGSITQHREVTGHSSLASQNSLIVHFGFGSSSVIDELIIEWPSGITQTLANVTVNQLLTVIEDNTGPVLTQLAPITDATDVNANTTLAITLNEQATAVAARNLRIFKTTDLVNPVSVIAVTSAVKTGNTFTFTLAQPLDNSTSYSVAIEVGAFKDIYGNDFAGLEASSWQFTTTAGPSTTLLSPANNAEDVAINSTLEITFNKAVTGVAGKTLDVFIQGSPEPEFSIDAATGIIAGNKITFTPPSAFEFQTLYDVVVEAGAFIDNFSNASNEITWSFLTIDNVAPVITFTAPTSVNKGAATIFSPIVTDNSGEVENAVLHYRKIAAVSFSTLQGVLNSGIANQYDFNVPATFFDETGLEYFFTATDLSGNEVRSPAGTNTYKLFVSYSLIDSKIPSAQLGLGGTKNGWKIFSIPFELGNSNSITAVFDELSDLENKIGYRFLKYKDQTGWGEFPTDFSTIERGEGYFINIKVAEDIEIGEGILAPSNDRNNLFQISLKQGWNMIGNPYLSTISWADVSAYNALTGTNAVLVKYTSGQYAQTNQNLSPFEGGLVFASAAATISVPFAGQTNAGVRTNDVVFGEGDWLMPLTISNGEFENTFGGIGMHKLADNSFDQFDGVNPPRFFEYSELNFAHPEHFAKNFSRDVVPTSDKYVWEFTVASNQSGSATLKWNSADLANLKQEIYLFDETLQQPVDMLSQSSYVFNPNESSRFRIYYGENIINEMLPNMVQLGKAYPNPSADVVSLPFSLPEAGGARQQVSIEVIDAMGKSYGTILSKAFAPGYYTFEWNGAQVVDTEGLYIFKVAVDNKQGKQIQQSRVLIKK
ncbi:FG-GAP-like repeat-containing protein [Chryseotalea sanaruensis]|nr:FG-GAP-like repeat-containing protein [Chryseotalea sanaruensis]